MLPSKTFLNNGPILFKRKPTVDYPPEKIEFSKFEILFSKIKEKCNLENQLTEENMLVIASAVGRLFRSNIKVIVDENEIRLSELLLTRLWIYSFAKAVGIENEEDFTKKYVINGGNVAFKEVVEPLCCFKFFPNSKLAQDHNRFFKSFLDNIPSSNFLYEDYRNNEYINLKTGISLSEIKMIINEKQATINNEASYNYQRYATGVPKEKFRFLGTYEEKNEKISIKRILNWEPSIIEKIEKLTKSGFTTQEIVGLVNVKKSNFALLREKGILLSIILQSKEEKLLLETFYELGVVLRELHEKGIGHDSPTEIHLDFENNKIKPIISSHEDIWFTENGNPIPKNERWIGIQKILNLIDEINNEELKKCFINGYGAEEFEKIKKES